MNDNIILFGEVLFDVYPDGIERLGGAPFNVAWHLRGFGMNPLMVSRIGNDHRGELVIDAMRSWGMDTSGIQTDRTHPTGIVQVSTRNNEPSFQILPNQAFDNIDGRDAYNVVGTFNRGVFYHGTLALRSQVSALGFTILHNRLKMPVVFDVNLRRPWWNNWTVSECLQHADWLKLNLAELLIIAKIKGMHDDNPIEIARKLLDMGQMSLVIVTLGDAGAFAADGDGMVVKVTPPRKDSVVDLVGAGDAFCATVILGRLLGWQCGMIIDRAGEFATKICQIRGATGENRDLYRKTMGGWGVRYGG